MFIFDRCCRSSTTVTPVKYECDTNNLTGTFTRSKILLTGKLTNGALVTPNPVMCHHCITRTKNHYTRNMVLIKKEINAADSPMCFHKNFQFKPEHVYVLRKIYICDCSQQNRHSMMDRLQCISMSLGLNELRNHVYFALYKRPPHLDHHSGGLFTEIPLNIQH